MKMSRRYFMGAAAGSAATLWSFPLIGLDASSSWPESSRDCVLLDVKSHCVLRESLQGYQAALGDSCALLMEPASNLGCPLRLVIVPGFASMEPSLAETLLGLLRGGTHVLLESGASFLSPADFVAHQKMLHRYFDIEVGRPIELWPEKSADDGRRSGQPWPKSRKKTLDHPESVPYVSYSWPRQTEVRDFSRVIPVSARAMDVIARTGATPTALKRHTAGGTLIFLGSPLGPALRAGDPEALSWLQSLAHSGPDARKISLNGAKSRPFFRP
jgi:hypothetical protein